MKPGLWRLVRSSTLVSELWTPEGCSVKWILYYEPDGSITPGPWNLDYGDGKNEVTLGQGRLVILTGLMQYCGFLNMYKERIDNSGAGTINRMDEVTWNHDYRDRKEAVTRSLNYRNRTNSQFSSLRHEKSERCRIQHPGLSDRTDAV